MTNKVVSKTLKKFYTKRKIFRKKFDLNFISSFVIFDFSYTFLKCKLNLKNLYLLFKS